MSSRKRNSVIEEFIDIYKSEDCLWRVKCKQYHDKNKRAAAYEKMTNKLKELEPNATKNDVIKKINSLRSNVKKEMKKCEESTKSGASADEVYKPTLWYFNLFDFLGDQNTPRESRSNMDDQDDNHSLINPAHINTEKYSTQKDQNENNLNSTNVPINESAVNDQQLLSNNSQTRGPRPPKKNKEDKLTNEVLATVNERFKRPAPQEDRYDLLRKTIAIKLRTLDKKQRLILVAEKILNDKLFKAEMGNFNHDSYQGINEPHYRTDQRIPTSSPTYIYSPIASSNSNTGTESSSSSLLKQAQTMHSQSYQDNQVHSGLSQTSYVVQFTQPSSVLSIPEDTMSTSSYFSNVTFENM